MPTPNEIFIAEIEAIEQTIIKELNDIIPKILQRNLTNTEKMLLIEDYNIEKRMIELGYDESMLKYVQSFDDAVIGSKFVNKISLEFANEVDLIQKDLGEYLLGKKKQFHNLLQMEIKNSIVSGQLTAETVANLTAKIPLADAQIKTVVHTSFSNHSRNITAKAFEEEPEQRFEYVGGVIPTSSLQCEWLMNNQNPGGYTKAEIDAGIQTPFGVIYWGGRDPNYNCIHEFLPIG